MAKSEYEVCVPFTGKIWVTVGELVRDYERVPDDLSEAERNQHWEGELSQECSRIANLAREIAEQAKRGR